MQYTNFEKAMAAIGTNDAAVKLIDHIASDLSKKNKAQVMAINNALSFNFPPFRTRPFDVDRIVDLRRAAILISKTFDTTPPLRWGIGRTAPYESWDDEQLDKYISEQKDKAERKPAPTGAPGVYLAGSFWAFANEDERSNAIAAYPEAVQLCTFGLLAVSQAERGSITGPSGIADVYMGLVRMWFGDQAGTVENVKDKLHTTLQGLKTNYLRLGYAGGNVSPDTTIKEVCFGSNNGAGKVITASVYGSAPSKSSAIKNKMVLGKPFFDPKSTSIALSEQIVAIDDEEKMDVSRGGTVLHEATHMYAGTQDVSLNNAVYEKLGLEPPSVKDKRLAGYGAQRCMAIARWDPASAINNADSYRVFCELAKYHRQRLGPPVVHG